MRTLPFKPYSSPLLNVVMRMPATGVENPSVSKIAVVGALFDKNFNLFHDDANTIKRTLNVLHRAGITVADIPSIEFHNLLPPIGSDFLAATRAEEDVPQSDLLIVPAVCKLSNATFRDLDWKQQEYAYPDFSMVYRDLDVRYAHNREVSISHHQRRSDAWALAAHKTGAKLVVTRGGSHDEISSSDFLAGGFYTAAMPTSEKFERMDTTVSGYLGIVVHGNAVDDLKKTANPEDPLGQRILGL